MKARVGLRSPRPIRACDARLAVHTPRLWLWIHPRPDSAALGRVGEELVARALRRSGHRIEGRRVRTPWGELDVLARDARGLACVEVKSARREPLPRIRGEQPIPRRALDRPGARVDVRGWERLERIARGIGARRGLPARAEVWEVLVGPRRGQLEIRRCGPI